MSLLCVGSVAYDVIELPGREPVAVLGGSATWFSVAASLLSKPTLVGVVGDDFLESDRAFLEHRGVGLEGLTRAAGTTFRWHGRYHDDLKGRDSLATELGVFAGFSPVIPPALRDPDVLMLGNIKPDLQGLVLAQNRRARFVALDTIEIWITGMRADLVRLMPRVDLLFLNDDEVRLLSGLPGIVADEHYFIRPGTDALFLLAAIHTVFQEKLDRPDALRGSVSNLRELRRMARDFSPERVAAATGMDPDHIRKIARDFSNAHSAACYGRMGICAQAFGTTATWLIDALCIITGNLDRPGGAMFPTPAIGLAELMSLMGASGQFGRWRTRVSGLPEFNSELPAVAMAGEIETPGRRQIRALITVGGNPALVIPNSGRLNRALGQLEFMVSLDPYLNATTRHAAYILPPAIGLEHDYYPVLSYSTAIHNYAKYAPAAIAPPPGVRHDWEILLEITQRLAARRASAPKPLEELFVSAGKRFDARGFLRLLLDIGPYGARAAFAPDRRRIRFRDLEENTHGMDLGFLAPQLKTLMGRRRINLAPRPLVEDLDRLRRRRDDGEAAQGAEPDELLLISRRQRRFLNTCLHNIQKLAAGPEQCVLEMHPNDAAARGIASGDRVTVSTKIGSLETEVLVTGGVMAGVVSLPFGWNGRRQGVRASVSDQHPGANVNHITDETLVDTVSGMSAFNGSPVAVSRVAQKQKKKKP